VLFRSGRFFPRQDERPIFVVGWNPISLFEELPMKMLAVSRLALRFGLVAALVCLCTSIGTSQDPKLKPTFGMVELKAGFPNDPYVKKVIAGGDIQTNLGGVTAWVAKEPDFRLNYTAGNFALTFLTDSKADTTLLIRTPDGKWLADDDGDGFPNAKIKIEKPASGEYNIWVGTIPKGMTPEALLKITELK